MILINIIFDKVMFIHKKLFLGEKGENFSIHKIWLKKFTFMAKKLCFISAYGIKNKKERKWRVCQEPRTVQCLSACRPLLLVLDFRGY